MVDGADFRFADIELQRWLTQLKKNRLIRSISYQLYLYSTNNQLKDLSLSSYV